MKKSRVICISALAAAFAIAGASRVYSQDKKDAGGAHKIVHFGDLKWTPIIKGCDVAAVDGDMNAEGTPFVLRIRCADGSKIPAHWHPTDENVTVLKGTFLVGMGESFDETKLQTMNIGNFVSMPKEMRHFAMSKGETVVQVHRRRPLQSELGESVRSAAARRCARSSGETKIVMAFTGAASEHNFAVLN